MNLCLWMLCLIGHIGFWCVVFNRVHATAFPRQTRKRSEKIILMAVTLPFVWVVAWMLFRRNFQFDSFAQFPPIWLYQYASVLLGCFFTGRWVLRKLGPRLPTSVTSQSRQWIAIGPQIEEPVFHGTLGRLLGAIPWNEASWLTIERMTFRLPVPKSLDGFKIAHLSDLHFTGQISKQYFQKVVEYANEFSPDIVVITGDLIDEAHCLDWLDDTLGQLKSRLGCFYVLGNHDLRIGDEVGLRARLHRIGLQQAAGNWVEIRDGENVIQLTGNELPWFQAASKLTGQPRVEAGLKILLSHSPDQLEWAKGFDFDLMLAGHTHGGQIAIPVVGPIVAPSKYGVLYASGTFQIGSMLMHVSRGISGDESIRIGSPPELGLFTISSFDR